MRWPDLLMRLLIRFNTSDADLEGLSLGFTQQPAGQPFQFGGVQERVLDLHPDGISLWCLDRVADLSQELSVRPLHHQGRARQRRLIEHQFESVSGNIQNAARNPLLLLAEQRHMRGVRDIETGLLPLIHFRLIGKFR